MTEQSQSPIASTVVAQDDLQRKLTQVRLTVEQLNASLWAHAALTGAWEAGLLDLLLQPRSATELAARTSLNQALIERMLDVLLALGLVQQHEGDCYVLAEGLMPLLRAPAVRESYLTTLRSQVLQSYAFVQSARDRTLAPGWRFTDPAILHAQGAGSVLGVQIIAEQMAPMLLGLADRLAAPTAAFLDVGTGVGRIAIEMCRRFPQLRVVGIDTQEASLAEAQRAVALAGLADRIELRRQAVEALSDRDAFDLVWMPQLFLSGEAFPRGLRTVYEALRPGGWLLLVSIARDGSDLPAAVSRLQDTLLGGDARTAEQVATLTGQAGYIHIRILPPPPGEPFTALVAQRPL
jgi:predicted O-methyltransferase YrrM